MSVCVPFTQSLDSWIFLSRVMLLSVSLSHSGVVGSVLPTSANIMVRGLSSYKTCKNCAENF